MYMTHLIMDKKLFDCIISHVHSKCPNKRKPKYTSEYYLTNILDVLVDFVKWSSLKKSKNYNGKNRYHYKTIADIHKLWSDSGVYKSAYEELVQKKNITTAKKNIIELLIDSTLIINKTGIECIGYGSESRKKKFTKLSALSNIDGKNVAISVDAIKTKERLVDPLNKYEKNRKNKKNNDPNIVLVKKYIPTLSHDVKNVEPIIETIKPILNGIGNKIKIKMFGDKGYVMKCDDKKTIKKKYNVKMVHSMRTNQKMKNTKNEEISLSKRYRIEHMFEKIKVYNRIHVRRDKTINCYMGFVYLGCIMKFGISD